MKKHTNGFTIIEMLISMTILIVIFAVTGAMMHSSRKHYQETAAIAEEVEITDAAARLIRYDISLAGYVGLDGVERDLGGEAVSVGPNDEPLLGEVVQVRYYEDRYTLDGQPELRYISYYVGQSLEGAGLIRDNHDNLPPKLLIAGADNLTTETLSRGINLRLQKDGSEQLIRIAFNIPDVVVSN